MKDRAQYRDWIFFLTLLSGIAACESLAPTPESSLVRVTALVDPVKIETATGGASSFSVPISVANTGAELIFYIPDCGYSLEKAENNRWYRLPSVVCTEGVLLTAISPGTATTLTITNSPSVDFPHLAGKYRIRVLLYFDEQRQTPLPENAGYSRPFHVID